MAIHNGSASLIGRATLVVNGGALGHLIDANTLALWRLNEATAASNFTDSSGNGKTLTVTGSPPVVASGKINGARTFEDVTPRYGSRTADTDFVTAFLGSYTIEAWVRPTIANSNVI